MEAMLDQQGYLESELVTIRIPLTLPYQTDTDGFERISGEVSFNGKIYKYVERKMEDGHFVLKCLPDHNKTQLEQEKNELAKSNADQSSNNSKPGGNAGLKFVFSEFEDNVFYVHCMEPSLVKLAYTLFNNPTYSNLRIAAPAQPPDLTA